MYARDMPSTHTFGQCIYTCNMRAEASCLLSSFFSTQTVLGMQRQANLRVSLVYIMSSRVGNIEQPCLKKPMAMMIMMMNLCLCVHVYKRVCTHIFMCMYMCVYGLSQRLS